MKPFSRLLLVGLSPVLGFTCVAAEAADRLNDAPAFILDANTPDSAAQWKEGKIFEFPQDSITAPADKRKVFYEKALKWEFNHLPKGKDCQVKATFLTEKERILHVSANGLELEDCLVPDKGKSVTREWTIPGKYLESGRLTLTIHHLSGPNAVLQKLEILTADGTPLKLTTGKDIAPVTDGDIDALTLPQPRLTPRPASVAGTANPILSLNGAWEFSPDAQTAFRPIQVPGEWKMQGFDVPRFGWAKYKKTFSLPADWKDKQVRLRFDAVHAVCKVFLNGKEIGGHKGGMVPFEFDITATAKPGDNVLEVDVQSESVADYASCLSFYAAHQVGGIIRKVTAFTVPKTCITREHYETEIDASTGKAILHYHASVQNSGDKTAQLDMDIQLKSPEGDKAGTQKQSLTLNPGEEKAVSLSFPVENARLWTSESPVLYRLESTLSANGEKSYSKKLKLGLRKVEVKGNQLFVNGAPVKLMGINRHEAHPLTGRTLTPELCKQDARLYKDANVNLIRTSHYPPSEEFLEACDELGLFVECEAAICWMGQNEIWQTLDIHNPVFFRYALAPNLDQITAFRNHPSIIIWSLSNESNWNQWWSRILNTVRKIDSSRPYSFHNQTIVGTKADEAGIDLGNYHYPSEDNPDSWSTYNQPLWFGEYAHLQSYNRRELMTDPSVHEDWSRPLQRMTDLMWNQKGSLGGAIWSGIDDLFYLPDGTACGYGSWGPLDGWRREKPEYHGMRMAYTPLRIFAVRQTEDGSLVLEAQNRFNYTPLDQLNVKWSNKGKSGKVTTDLAPHAKGEIKVNGTFRPGDEIDILLLDKKGKEIARERVAVPTGQQDKTIPGEKNKFSTPQIDGGRKTIATPALAALSLPVPLVQATNGEGGTQLTGQKIYPLTDLGKWNWTEHSLQGETHVFHGEGDAGKGSVELTPTENGLLRVKYTLTVAQDLNPRQWGLVFSLPGEFDTIEWNRNTHLSWYPEDHIGRARGKARANAVDKAPEGRPAGPVTTPWKDDANALGSNDFRGSKLNINRCSLKTQKGAAFTIIPADKDKKQDVRAWKTEQGINVLVSAFTMGGSDRFFWIHYKDEYKPLKKGDTVQSEFLIGINGAK